MESKIIAGIVICLVLAGCMNVAGVDTVDDSLATPEGVNDIANANNQFAFELYSELKESDEGSNIFFSPYSLHTALAMTYEGAKGNTSKEMEEVLHLPEDDIARGSAFARIQNLINKDNKAYELNAANALWAQQNYTFLDSYMDFAKKYYLAEITNLDFVRDAEGSRQTINSWVEEQTNDKIQDLIPHGAITHLTRLVLTNAIYFKGEWQTKFDEKNTRESDFYTSPEETVKVQMMSLTGRKSKFNYTETESLQMLEMPYKGNELSMLVILPKENLSAVEESLSAEKINELKARMRRIQINVFMPKFKFETKYFLPEALSNMGMPTAFNPMKANFSGMTGNNDLFISNVIHQAFVEVNEEGTEAAAATAVIMTMAAIPMEFRADHPFIFIIQQKQTGSILFMGRVANPALESS